MNIIAHRGDTTHAVDNTMEAFQSAYDAKAFGIEFDVRGTIDHLPVVHHHMEFQFGDETHFIADYSYRQLNAITATSHGQPYHIPALGDVLAHYCGKMVLEIHIQSYDRQTVESIARVLQPYRQYWGMIELTSFEPAILLACRACCPGIHCDLLFQPAEWMSEEIVIRTMIDKATLGRANGVHLFPHQVTPSTLDRFREQGFSVHCGVVNDPSVAAHIAALGVNQFCTDNIYLFLNDATKQ